MPRHYLSLVFLILFWESFKFNTFFDVYAHWCLEIRGPVTTVSIFLHSCSVPSTLLLLSWFFFVVIPHTYPWHLIPSGWMQRRRSTHVCFFFMWYPSGIKRIDCARRSFSRKENFLVSNGDILCGANFWRIFVKRRSSRIWLNCGGPEFPSIFLATLFIIF